MLKKLYLDDVIIYLMFFLLPIDILNGILLRSDLVLPISVSQLFKIILLLFILVKFCFTLKHLFVVLSTTLILLTPSIIQIILQGDFSFILSDTVKAFRYVMPLYSFLFFISVVKKGNQQRIKRIYSLVVFSYFILVISIFLKYIGLGYPMYSHGNIGSKGFFYAGNEISALLIILSSIIGNKLWKEGNKKKYLLTFILSVVTGIAISSKTGILGISLVFLLIPIGRPKFRWSKKRLVRLFLSILVVIPALFFFIWQYVKSSAVYHRLSFFWDKLDIWTFLLSNRNNFFQNALNTYYEEYTFIEKVIGVGQTKYEYLNGSKIVEIDIFDIFFAYGYIGLLVFMSFIFYLLAQAKQFSKKDDTYKNSNFVVVMILFLFGISSTAGHVFSSGMSAVFIGVLFSLMYLKNTKNVI